MSDDHSLLMRYARSHDAEAFAQLVKRYSTLVYSVAQRVTGNITTAEDVTQECFFALARQAASINGSLPAWLHRVALNLSLKVTRNEATRHRHEAKASLPSNIDNEPSWSQISPLIDAALAKLPDDLREPLVRHFLLGHTQTQVAEDLNIAQASVSRRLHEGVERLREYLKQIGVVCGATMLSTSLVKNASAAVSVRLSTELAKIALAGPVKIAATASTSIIPSYGGLSLTLIKGALKLMALTKLKTAVVASVAIILTVSTATIVVYERRPYPWQVQNPDYRILDQVPPQLKIVPAKFHHSDQWIHNGKMLGMERSINDLLDVAYNTCRYRMVFTTELPEDHYDYIANLPEGNQEALRREIERQFNLTAKTEKRKTDVLLLTVKNHNAQGLKQSENISSGTNINVEPGHYRCTNIPFSQIASGLEYYFEIPVIDRTGLAGKFDINLKWRERDREHRNPVALKKVLLEALGLELVPGREEIEMLVVEKTH